MKKISLSGMIEFYGDEPRTGTLFIAEGFQREHRKIVDVIRKHQEKFKTFGLILDRKSKPKGGRPVIEYMLNEGQTVFLGSLLKNTEVIIDFKLKLAHVFILMKDALAKIRLQKHDPEYIRARIEGKIPRRLETTILSELVPYSVNQGSEGYSKNPENCYINYTTMTNNALFIVAKGFKNIRNYLDKKQLRRVAVAEDVIADLVTIKMAEGLHYKEIYQEIKKKVEAYGEIIGKTKVPKIEYQKQLALF